MSQKQTRSYYPVDLQYNLILIYVLMTDSACLVLSLLCLALLDHSSEALLQTMSPGDGAFTLIYLLAL